MSYLDFLIPLLLNNWYEIVMTILSLGLLAKFVAIRMAAKDFADWMKVRQDTASNGVVDEAEWAKRGRAGERFLLSVLGILKGLFPNKSKVVL